ncbi:MAG: aminotransferase class I/II-fold pyridoxal phosphate-dependent enzyme [archaeon]|nr:aminotransferase class I/II-fold pyridoxal phosphate-dependent enzyme [archaeon]
MKIKQKLKKELSQYSGLKNVVLFSSCRNALYILLKSFELKSTDEVIIQSFICDSLPNAIRLAGGKPVSVDVDSRTLNLNADSVKNKITPQTKAVIFVHTYGNPSGIKEIAEICKKHNLILIEDIAHALGAKCDGRLAGTFGDYAVYSFTKQMINFGGGAILTNHNIDKISLLRDQFRNKGSLLVYIKRLFASLYETRAFFISKILIDIARKKSNLKQTNDLDKHFHCTSIEAYLAFKQLPNLNDLILKKRKNHQFIQNKVNTQKILADCEASHNYLSFIFNEDVESSVITKTSFLFLPPWSGSNISNRIIFMPNNLRFSLRKLKLMVANYHKIYNQTLIINKNGTKQL